MGCEEGWKLLQLFMIRGIRQGKAEEGRRKATQTDKEKGFINAPAHEIPSFLSILQPGELFPKLLVSKVFSGFVLLAHRKNIL